MAELFDFADPLIEQMAEFAPHLAASLLLLLAGWVIAALTRFVVRKVLRGLHSLLHRKLMRLGARASRMETAVVEAVPHLLYWFIILFFLAAATEAMGLPVFTSWLSHLGNYIPKILSALVIIFAGLWFGSFLKTVTSRGIATTGLPYGELLGRLAQISLVTVTIIIAVNQLGIDLTFLTDLATILIGGLLLGATIAFGLGARTMVSNIVTGYYVHRFYKVGSVVEINGVQGTIIKMPGPFVILETNKGQMVVPSKHFAETVSMQVKEAD